MKEADFRRLVSRIPAQPGIGFGGRYVDYVVFIPFVLSRGEYCLLFEKRAAGIRQGGEIGFPGGRFEPDVDESREAAALRETVEELGVDRALLSVLGQTESVFTHWGARVSAFIGTIGTDDPAALSPNPDEVERTLLVPVSFFAGAKPAQYRIRLEMQPSYVDEQGTVRVTFPAEELGLPRHYWKAWDGGFHAVSAYRYAGEVIWGLTAELVLSVLRMLE